MYCCKRLAVLGLLVVLHTRADAGEGYIAGVGGEVDTNDGRAISAFIDYGLTEKAWVSASVARTLTAGILDLDTDYVDGSLEYNFDPIGFRIGGAYWGDDDVLDSVDARGSLFYRSKAGSLTLNLERRNFELDIESRQVPGRTFTFDFTADGIGGAGWLKVNDKVNLFASGMAYNYSQDLRVENIERLRFLSFSRLSLINSLIDYRVSGGVDFRVGERIIDVSWSTWQTAIDAGRVSSISVGLLAPSGLASDLELRVAYDESDNFGSTVALAIRFFYFGA